LATLPKRHLMLALLLLLPSAFAQDQELEGGVVLRGFDPASLRSPALALQDPLGEAGGRGVSHAADRSALELSFTHGDLTYVRERRRVRLLPGAQPLSFHDLPGRLLAASVQVRAVDASAPVQVLEQRLLLPVQRVEMLLRGRVGQPATLLETRGDGSVVQTPAEIAGYDAGVLLRMEDQLLLRPTGTLVLPTGPDTPRSPTLHWLLESEGGERELELRYACRGITARTILHLQHLDGERGLLSAWLQVDNRTMAEFEAAELLLPSTTTGYLPLPRPATLRRHQVQEISLLAPVEVTLTPELVLRTPRPGQRARVHQAYRLDPPDDQSLPEALAGLDFNLVQFLPEGDFQSHDHGETALFRRNGTWILVGAPREEVQASRSEHGAAQEDGSITLRVLYDLRNASTSPVAVQVWETLPDGWQLSRASSSPSEQDAGLLQFELDLPPFAMSTLDIVMEFSSGR